MALPSGRKVALTFPEAAKEYLTKLEEIGGKGIERKKCQLDLHLKPFFRQKVLSKISSFDLERYKKHRVDEGASFATVNRELAVLGATSLQWPLSGNGSPIGQPKSVATKRTTAGLPV